MYKVCIVSIHSRQSTRCALFLYTAGNVQCVHCFYTQQVMYNVYMRRVCRQSEKITVQWNTIFDRFQTAQHGPTRGYIYSGILFAFYIRMRSSFEVTLVYTWCSTVIFNACSNWSFHANDCQSVLDVTFNTWYNWSFTSHFYNYQEVGWSHRASCFYTARTGTCSKMQLTLTCIPSYKSGRQAGYI